MSACERTANTAAQIPFDTMEYFIAGIFLIIALYLITQPMFGPGRSTASGGPTHAAGSGDRLASLKAKKQLLDENITDLEFEYRMGKLSKEDFDGLQAGCANEANELKQALSEFRADKKIDEQLEMDVRKRRKLG